MTKQGIVYLVRIITFGLFYAPIKAATGGGIWLFLAAIGYLALVRLIGYGIAKRWPDRVVLMAPFISGA